MLLRLFLLGVPVARVRFDALVGAELRARSRGAGLLLEDGELVHGAARLVPHDELVIASDHAGGAEEHADHVPGVHRPSVALAHLTVRGQGEHALDVATGNGIQAILLAAHADRVVATDVNPRAVAYAAFNTALNGACNVETRVRQLLRAGGGRAVRSRRGEPALRDLTREQLPVPRRRHARRRRLGACRARPPAALAPGGFASILIAWAVDSEDPRRRPLSWLEGSGCDAYLLHTSTDDPIETAPRWNRELLDRPDAFAEALDRWLAYYRELGIEHIGYACLVLRKRADGRDG